MYSVKRTSPFTPMLYLCLITIPSLAFAEIWEQDGLRKWVLIGMLIFVAVAAVAAYFFFALNHPEMLRGGGGEPGDYWLVTDRPRTKPDRKEQP